MGVKYWGNGAADACAVVFWAVDICTVDTWPGTAPERFGPDGGWSLEWYLIKYFKAAKWPKQNTEAKPHHYQLQAPEWLLLRFLHAVLLHVKNLNYRRFRNRRNGESNLTHKLWIRKLIPIVAVQKDDVSAGKFMQMQNSTWRHELCQEQPQTEMSPELWGKSWYDSTSDLSFFSEREFYLELSKVRKGSFSAIS